MEGSDIRRKFTYFILVLHVYLGKKEKGVAKRAQMTSNCSCDTNKKEVKLCSKKKISQSS